MTKANVSEDAMLRLVLRNEAWVEIGDPAGLLPSATAGNIYVALHEADPGEAGDQSTSESTYTNYARAPVARAPANWTQTLGTGLASNVNAIQFIQAAGGSSTVTHTSVGGRTGAGAEAIVWSGALTQNVTITSGIQPQFVAGALTIQED